MPRFDRALAGSPELVERGNGVIECGDEAGDGPGGLGTILHGRDMLYRAGSWHFRCRCGYVSHGFVDEVAARTWPCPVEALLAESAVRLRHLHGMTT